jgi:hypothetical protein
MSAVYPPRDQGSLAAVVLVCPREWARPIELEAQTPVIVQKKLPIDSLMKSLESPVVVDAVQSVFRDLFRLLDSLHSFQCFLLKIDHVHDQADDTLARFELVQAEARSVAASIGTLATQTKGTDAAVSQILDGVAIAIGHHLREARGCQPGDYQEPAGVGIGELSHNNGLLRNCARESILTLARHFDPTITGEMFFDDSDKRLRETFVLCDDLVELIQFLRHCAVASLQSSILEIVQHIARFRSGSMRLLMHRDWKEYEMFAKRITLASADANALQAVLDSFACYLETLLRLVSSRAVLANDPLPAEIERLSVHNRLVAKSFN